MSEHAPEPDPRSRFEDEGIPDLQDGTPEQQWAVDPQEAPLPGDRPVATEEFGTTVAEEIAGEPLDGRLDREVPDEQPAFGVSGTGPGQAQAGTADAGTADAGTVDAGTVDAGTVDAGTVDAGTVDARTVDARTGEPDLTEDSGLGVGSDLDTRYAQDTGTGPDWQAQPEEPSGQVWDEPRPAGRIVSPDQGAHTDTEPDEVAEEAGPDAGGYTAEESAMRVEPE